MSRVRKWRSLKAARRVKNIADEAALDAAIAEAARTSNVDQSQNVQITLPEPNEANTVCLEQQSSCVKQINVGAHFCRYRNHCRDSGCEFGCCSIESAEFAEDFHCGAEPSINGVNEIDSHLQDPTSNFGSKPRNVIFQFSKRSKSHL